MVALGKVAYSQGVAPTAAVTRGSQVTRHSNLQTVDLRCARLQPNGSIKGHLPTLAPVCCNLREGFPLDGGTTLT